MQTQEITRLEREVEAAKADHSRYGDTDFGIGASDAATHYFRVSMKLEAAIEQQEEVEKNS